MMFRRNSRWITGVYALIAIATWGSAANSFACDVVKPGCDPLRSFMLTTLSSTAWPLYWSWEIQRG